MISKPESEKKEVDGDWVMGGLTTVFNDKEESKPEEIVGVVEEEDAFGNFNDAVSVEVKSETKPSEQLLEQ